MVIAERLLELEFDGDLGAYRLRPSRVASFGEDALLPEAFLNKLTSRHTHAVVPVALNGKTITALGLVSEQLGVPHYVEIDNWEEPIQISENEISAIHSLDRALTSGPISNKALQELT